MKFKVGDKVRRINENWVNGGIKIGDIGEITKINKNGAFSYGYSINLEGYPKDYDPLYFELISSGDSEVKSMNTLEKFKLAFKSEPEKTFRKLGITDGDDLLTSEGQTIFLGWLLEKNKNDFKKEVCDPMLAEKEEK